MKNILTGKVAIVTGPTSGIGRNIAEGLAAQGAHVVLACRDMARGKEALSSIEKATGSKDLSIIEMEASSRESIAAFASRFKESHKKLHILVNNAGINMPTRKVDADGIELVFSTNVLGYFRLTLALQDLLAASAPARVVNVASTFAGELDMEDLQFKQRKYDGMNSYKQSKACNRMLTRAFSRRLSGGGVTVNSMAPGLVMTGLYRNLPAPMKVIIKGMNLAIGRSVEEGADTAIWLASSPEVEGVSGKFFEKRKEMPCEFEDKAKEGALYEECLKLSPQIPV